MERACGEGRWRGQVGMWRGHVERACNSVEPVKCLVVVKNGTLGLPLLAAHLQTKVTLGPLEDHTKTPYPQSV